MREMVAMGTEKEKQVPITSKEAEGGILVVMVDVFSGLLGGFVLQRVVQ